MLINKQQKGRLVELLFGGLMLHLLGVLSASFYFWFWTSLDFLLKARQQSQSLLMQCFNIPWHILIVYLNKFGL